MKRSANLFAGVALMAIVLTGCQTTATTEVPMSYTVIEIGGNARYFEGESEAPHDLKVGAEISEGTVIQTASGVNNWVGLMPDNSLALAIPANLQSNLAADKMELFENSALEVAKLTRRSFKGRTIKDTRLALRGGSLVCDIDSPWPTHDDPYYFGPAGPRIESVQPRPDASYFEIRASNISVHAEHAVFFFSASGIIRVVQGSVAIEISSTGIRKDLFSGQQYDAAADEIRQVDTDRVLDGPMHPAFWEWVWARKPRPDNTVPQRPF